MVTDVFDGLLQELGKILGTTLHPGRKNSCLIKLKEGIKVQLELDTLGENLIIGSDLGQIPTGKYRENLFKEGLRFNGMLPPRNGILAFSKQADHLIIFEKLPLKNLTGAKIADALTPFKAKTILWRDALARGDIPSTPSAGFKSGGGIFGLKP